MEEKEQSRNTVDLYSTIGFNGAVRGGLLIHPDQKHLIYSIGSTVVVRDISKERTQHFLSGHTHSITCLALSPDGRYIASGQVTSPGFKAQIIVWDFAKRIKRYSYSVHNVRVKALAFSPNSIYLASLGGEEDGQVAVFGLESGKPISGAIAARGSSGHALCLAYSNTKDNCFVTGGEFTLRVWEIDHHSKKLSSVDCQLGTLKRVITSITVDASDEFMWGGTSTGDIVQVVMATKLLRGYGPDVKTGSVLSKGVTSIAVAGSEIVAGGGTGSVMVIRKENFMVSRMVELEGGVASLSLLQDKKSFYAGTEQSNIFLLGLDDLKPELISSAHYSKVNDVVYPWDYSELFATCSHGDIRVWNGRTSTELVRIHVPLITCNCIQFARDGKSIISGWDDGKIRAFTPQTGKLLYTIHDAHQQGVSALAITPENDRILSGGRDGQVRLWRIGKQSQTLELSTKEHKGPITSLAVFPLNPSHPGFGGLSGLSGSQCISSSMDGACMVWDISKMVVVKRLIFETMFKDVSFHPQGTQAVTGGTDKKMVYWELAKAAAVREVDNNGAIINTVAVSQDGNFLITGGVDMTLKIWDYSSGGLIAEGHGHSGAISRVRVSPDNSTIVSVGEEGAIYIWNIPQQ